MTLSKSDFIREHSNESLDQVVDLLIQNDYYSDSHDRKKIKKVVSSVRSNDKRKFGKTEGVLKPGVMRSLNNLVNDENRETFESLVDLFKTNSVEDVVLAYETLTDLSE